MAITRRLARTPNPGVEDDADRVAGAVRHFGMSRRHFMEVGRVMRAPRVARVSAENGEGIDEWIGWLDARRPRRRDGEGQADG